MILLAIGDVVGSAGCEFLRKNLPALKREYSVELVIVNGENSADGNGITPYSAEFLLDSGVDLLTTGNHVFRRKEIYGMLDESSRILRPANYPDSTPGRGYALIDTGRVNVCVINLMGTVFLEPLDSPFKTADKILATLEKNTITLIDFHAEATSEKRALAFYLDGRVSAVVGTHTHVQTADEEVLPEGTGFLTDLGMTGPTLSVLGVEPQLAIRRHLTKMPVRFNNANTPCMLNGAVLDIDSKTGRTNFIKRIQIK